ncbi:hypothetical protein [Anaerofustis sp. NSJ-163]|uniref:hypothetical protein n=1 Tax=Anaerofustis sp. NSJ-163 TaxID=2944391 RepID=UPI00209C1F24|nr:hypothetical protein [Anaerofustis sp. NSJ-163]MCO8194054.1 hypothetical protein [Anaerofustis sp. NSJ-163]
MLSKKLDDGVGNTDNASKKLSKYILDNNIDIEQICKETGLNYNNVKMSIDENKKSLDVDEFLEICSYINKDPKNFK